MKRKILFICLLIIVSIFTLRTEVKADFTVDEAIAVYGADPNMGKFIVSEVNGEESSYKEVIADLQPGENNQYFNYNVGFYDLGQLKSSRFMEYHIFYKFGTSDERELTADNIRIPNTNDLTMHDIRLIVEEGIDFYVKLRVPDYVEGGSDMFSRGFTMYFTKEGKEEVKARFFFEFSIIKSDAQYAEEDIENENYEYNFDSIQIEHALTNAWATNIKDVKEDSQTMAIYFLSCAKNDKLIEKFLDLSLDEIITWRNTLLNYDPSNYFGTELNNEEWKNLVNSLNEIIALKQYNTGEPTSEQLEILKERMEEVSNNANDYITNANAQRKDEHDDIIEQLQLVIAKDLDPGGRGSYGDFYDIFENVSDYEITDNTTDEDVTKLQNKVNIILTVITNIGMILAVLMSAILGVKYMLGSVEEKADYKKDLGPYLIGAGLLFGICAIVKVLQQLGQTINNI